MKWQDISVEIKLCPLGAVCPCPRAVYMYKIMKKKCIKPDFKKIFFETSNKWPTLNLQQMTIVRGLKSWYQNFWPNELSARAQGLCFTSFPQ